MLETLNTHTRVRPEALHVAAILRDSELHSGRSLSCLGRCGQDARVLLVDQGDIEVRRVGVIQSSDNDLGLGDEIQQGP